MEKAPRTTIVYPNFTVSTNLELPVTDTNFYMHDICVNRNTISRREVSKYQVEGLLSGDISRAKEALQSIIRNREYWLNELKTLAK